MATFSKQAKGWRAQVAIAGVHKSKTFATKAEAISWSAQRETEIQKGAATGVQRGRTVDEAFRRYEKEVSIHKKGRRAEAIRLATIGRMEIAGAPLKDIKLADVTPEVLGAWRDHRLLVDKVLGSTVNRDLNLLSHVFSTAVKEWKWIARSPTTDVRRPKDPPPRDRLYSEDEIERLCSQPVSELAPSAKECHFKPKWPRLAMAQKLVGLTSLIIRTLLTKTSRPRSGPR